MQITGQEVAAASSVVAALAIVGGYLGVWSTNQNALKIAREERSFKQKEAETELKRAAYLRLLVALRVLAAASLELSAIQSAPNIPSATRLGAIRKRIEATQAANTCVIELGLTSGSIQLRNLANDAFKAACTCSRENAKPFIRETAKLTASLRDDLRGTEISSPEELDRMVDVALDRNSPETTASSISDP
jgi:hypothetical protein